MVLVLPGWKALSAMGLTSAKQLGGDDDWLQSRRCLLARAGNTTTSLPTAAKLELILSAGHSFLVNRVDPPVPKHARPFAC